MFSVVIPLYNKELSVKSTVQSVLNQSFSDFEIVIVNDGSTDNSVEVVEGFDDPRIRIIHQKNQGVSAARNKGIEEAKYEWIAFLDADDLWKENHLKEMMRVIGAFPREKVFCTSYIRSDEEEPDMENDNIELITNYFKHSLEAPFFWTSVVCMNKTVFSEVGGFKTFLSRGEDLDLWDRIGRRYHFVRSHKITGVYRIEAENRSDQSFDLIKSRIYNYDFKNSESAEETCYYQKAVSRGLRRMLYNIQIKDFLRLYSKHFRYIKIKNVFVK